MKKFTRILSVALVAVMVLSLSAVAFADTPSVYIPKRLSKLVSADLGDFVYPTLKTHTTALAGVKDADGNKVYSEYCKDAYTGKYVQVRSITEDSVMQFQFSEKPDWFGCTVSTKDYAGGWANIDIDDSGYGELEVGELSRQPGTFYAQGKGWTWTGSDEGFYGGKDYDTYGVNVSYRRDGSAYSVKVTLKDSEDFFRTGMEGGVMSITFKSSKVETDCGSTTVWYVAQVSATYPEGNYIIGVEANFRNDAKNNMCGYAITYAVSENAIYKITYAPNTTTIYENPGYTDDEMGDGYFVDLSKINSSYAYLASVNFDDGTAFHHYTADEAIYGQFYKSRADWENGSVYAVSGSGSKLNKWYASGHGKQIKSIKKGTTSFKSPRTY